MDYELERMRQAAERWREFAGWQAGMPEHYRQGLYAGVVGQVQQQYPQLAYIPPELMAGLMRVESRWHPYAVSSSGAEGVAQVKPSTADWMMEEGIMPEQENFDLFNPDHNIMASMYYLDWLKKTYGLPWFNTLQMYNLGPTAYREGKRNKDYARKILRKGKGK